MKQSKAFTLVELLVVISIIALLVSVLLPALGRARESARATVCLANMRSMAISSTMYAEDNDGYFPHAVHTNQGQGSWVDSIQSYTDQPLLHRCPSDISIYFNSIETVSNQYRRTSYALNYYLAGKMSDYQTNNRLVGNHPSRLMYINFMSELVSEEDYRKYARYVNKKYANELATPLPLEFAPNSAERTMFTADHVHPENWLSEVNWNLDGAWKYIKASKEVAWGRHGGFANYNFIDGHAAKMEFTDLYDFDLDRSMALQTHKYILNKYDPKIAK